MEHSSLQRKVDAAIIKNHLTSSFGPFHVEATGKGKVHVTGLTYSNEDRNRVVEVVKSVPGVSEVTDDITVMPPGY